MVLIPTPGDGLSEPLSIADGRNDERRELGVFALALLTFGLIVSPLTHLLCQHAGGGTFSANELSWVDKSHALFPPHDERLPHSHLPASPASPSHHHHDGIDTLEHLGVFALPAVPLVIVLVCLLPVAQALPAEGGGHPAGVVRLFAVMPQGP